MTLKHVKRATACASGYPYIAPKANDSFDSSKPITFTWDPTCYTTSSIDIHLSAPYLQQPDFKTFGTLDREKGSYEVLMKPKWWNSTSSVTLILNIVEGGSMGFLTTYASGPTFTVNYDASAAATDTALAAAANTAIPESPYVSVNNIYHGKGLSKGGLAAAVLFPLLAVFTALGIYVKLSRDKETKKRQRWSQAVDKRMSTISTDWKSLSAAGASHAIRQSMAVGDRTSRSSSFFASNGPRPTSTFDGRYGGVGLGGNLAGDSNEMGQLRTPRLNANTSPQARVSRVSFATDAHPRQSTVGSIYTAQGSRTSRAYHRGTVYDDNSEIIPPLPLHEKPRESVDELMNFPAISMMRTNEGSNDPFESPKTTAPLVITKPVSPPPAAVTSPITAKSSNFGIPMPSISGTPDDMMKAYAAARATTVKRQNTVEMTNHANGGMRVLYAPQQEEESAYDEGSFYGYEGSSVGAVTEESHGEVRAAHQVNPYYGYNNGYQQHGGGYAQ